MSFAIKHLETIYRGYSTLMMATLTAPDGTSFKREIEHHGHAAAVLPYDPVRRTALLVRAPRAPALWAGGPPELIEAPAGMIDAGESAEACARREALEEAGVELGELEPVAGVFASPGVSTERLSLYLSPYQAKDLIADGGGIAHEQEHITVVELPLSQLWAWVERKEILDLKTLALTLALRVRRPELFGDQGAARTSDGGIELE